MKLPRDVSGAKIVKTLERLGFVVTRQTGSHVRMTRDNLRVTVPMHRSMAVGTLQSIIRQTGISPEEFLAAL